MSESSGPHAETTVRLEGFSEGLKGQKVFCIASAPKDAETMVRGRLAALDAEVAHRGRKILVFQGAGAVPKWLLTVAAWDALFHVRDVQDLKLVITHLQYASKPVRVVWAGMEPAANVLMALARLEGGFSLLGVGPVAPASNDWQALFWASSAAVEDVEGPVALRLGASNPGLRAVLKELRASGVGLVWSSIGESDKRGALYWYDPEEGVEAAPLDLREAAETLRAVADLLGAGATGRGK